MLKLSPPPKLYVDPFEGLEDTDQTLLIDKKACKLLKEMRWCTDGKTFKSVKKLKFISKQLRAQEISYIEAILSRGNRNTPVPLYVKSLTIRDCRVNRAQMREICHGLKGNQRLTYLNIANNCISI